MVRLEYLKNKFDKLKRTKRGITYINILHTLQKVERKLLDKLERKLLGKLERKLCKLGNAPKILFFIFYCVCKNEKQCNLASPPKYVIWDTPRL